ncbi:MAG TPA: hypothetical protein VF148_11370, partial [Acidimicrobiia bacterium]
LLGDGLQRRQRHGRIRMAGTWIALPLSPGEMLASLPLGVAARLGLGAARAVLTPSAPGPSPTSQPPVSANPWAISSASPIQDLGYRTR